VPYQITPSSFKNDGVGLLFDHVNWRPSNEISCSSRSDIEVLNAKLNGYSGSHRIFKTSNRSHGRTCRQKIIRSSLRNTYFWLLSTGLYTLLI
jgi:hypothetical protein